MASNDELNTRELGLNNDDDEKGRITEDAISEEDATEELTALLGSSLGDDVESDDRETRETDAVRNAAEISFSVRYLTLATALLLMASYGFLFNQCSSGQRLRRLQKSSSSSSGGTAAVTEWRWISGSNRLGIYTKAQHIKTGHTGITFATLSDRAKSVENHKTLTLLEIPNDKMVVGDFPAFHRVLSPYLGFTNVTIQNATTATTSRYHRPLVKVRDDPFVLEMCPLVYTSVARPLSKRTSLSRFQNAPVPLLIGQCLWNATQVLHLALLVCILSISTTEMMATNHSSTTADEPSTAIICFQRRRRIILWLIILVATASTVFLLPVAAYLSSPGAHAFAVVTMVLITLTTARIIKNGKDNDRLVLSITPTTCCSSRNSDTTTNNTTTNNRSIFLIWEETLCMLCYVGSSLYNSAAGGSYKGFPHFVAMWKWIDSTFHLKYKGDLTFLFYDPFRGWNNAVSSIPPFVPRTKGGIARNVVFSGVWTILPFLYSFDFVVMIIMSHKSPGKHIQRFLAIFGLFHFLFGTDMIAYQYGRGYRNEHEDFFHWWEKWSWRISILLPIYQNCTNGHWEKNGGHHYRFPILGRIHYVFAVAFGIGFFIFQTLQADSVRTYGFLTGGDAKQGLIQRWGLEKKNSLMKALSYPYHYALVWSWSMYLFLQVACFRLNRVSLFRVSSCRQESTSWNETTTHLYKNVEMVDTKI